MSKNHSHKIVGNHTAVHRRSRILACLALLLSLAQPGRLWAQYVHFPDTNLENGLSAALRVPVGSITTNDMLGLTYFNGSWQNIQDTTGLQTAQNLTQLYLNGDPLTNFFGLAQLWKLNSLDLYSCQLSNVWFLSGLTNLTSLEVGNNTITNADPFSDLGLLSDLELSDNSLSDVSPLAGLTNLIWLDLQENQITNIPPLPGLTNLTEVWLGWNPGLTNASGLAGLTRLSTLDFYDDQGITSVSMVAGLTNLTSLYIPYTGVADLSPLITLARLQVLEINYTPVTNAFVLSNVTSLLQIFADGVGLTNAAFVADLPELQTLDMGWNPLSDASFLSALSQVTSVQLDDTQLTNLPSLAGLQKLTVLYLENDNELTNIDGVTGATNLQSIDLQWSQVATLPALAGLTSLSSLYLNGNPLTTLDGLAGLTNLTELEMGEIGTLTNFDALGQLTALQDLDAWGSGISDLSPLSTLTNLSSLNLWNDDVGDASPLAGLTNLSSVSLGENVLTSMDALTNLPSLGYLVVTYNLIDFSPGSPNAKDLQLLQNQGATVYYDPQNSLLPQFGITAQPADQTVAPGSTATFSVTVNSSISPLQYQWQYQDADLPGQTADTLVLPGVQTGQAGRYRVRVTDNIVSGWHIYSRSAQLVVQGGAGTSPDLTVAGAVGTIPNSVNAGATLTVSYTITNQGGNAPTSNTRIEIKPGSSGLDTTAVVHSTPPIAAGATLTENANVSIPALAPPGTYTVYVTLDCDDSIGQVDRVNNVAQTAVGSLTILPPITLGAALNVPHLTFTTGGDAPWFVETTKTYDGVSAAQSGSIGLNQSSTLSTTVIGPGNISFWWTIDAGTGDALFFDYPGGGFGIANRGGVWAYQSSVEIPPGPATLTWTFWRDATPGAGADAAWLDDVTYASYVPTAPDLTGSGSVGVSPNPIQPGNNLTVTYTVTNQGNGDAPVSHTLIQVNPGSSTVSTVESIHSTSAIAASASLTENVTVAIPASTASGAYTVYVTLDYDDAIGQSDTGNDTAQTAIGALSIQAPPPVVTLGPQWKYPGDSCALSALVASIGPCSYQWYSNGVVIAGATSASLASFTASYANAGSYSLVASNSAGAVTNSVKLVVAPIFYQITDLGTLWPGNCTTYTTGLNNWGDVVGYCITNSNSTGHAWVWSHGVMSDLGDALGGGDSQAYGINDQGDIVGSARVGGTTNYDAVRWRHSGSGYAVDDLGRTNWPFAFAQAINNAGDIAFSTTDGGFYGNGHRRAYLWRQGGLLPLGGLVPVWTNAPEDAYGWAINSMGAIAGNSVGASSPGTNPLKIAWRYNGSYRDNLQALYPITNLPPTYNVDSSGASYVNDYGDVAGDALRSDYGAVMAAYLISDTNVVFVEEGWNSIVGGLNNHGDIEVLSEDQTGFYFSLFCSTNSAAPRTLGDGRPDYSDHALFALPDLLPGGAGGFENLAQNVDYSLNEAREIAGNGTFTNGENHAFLATPLARAGNHPPVATNLTVTNFSSTLLFPISTLLNGSTDADGDTLALLTTTQPSAAGATVRRNAGNLIYSTTNTAPNTDGFGYIIMDYHGGMATNMVQVVNRPGGPSPQVNQILLLGSPGSSMLIRFHGYAGQTWRIQATDNLINGAWTTIATVIAGSDGLIDATEAFQAAQPCRFYRAVSP
jgi:internalin A